MDPTYTIYAYQINHPFGIFVGIIGGESEERARGKAIMAWGEAAVHAILLTDKQLTELTKHEQVPVIICNKDY